jgi:hypothetical protein
MSQLQVAASRTPELLTDNPNGDVIDGQTEKESWKPQTPPLNADSQTSRSETKIATSADPNRQTQPEAKTKTKERSPTSGTFRVFDSSFVRDKPRSDANITAMLEPGTRIKIQSKTGDYFRVRSLDGEPISGYVHREDAFFEPVKK